jgi:hypothetical protein
MGAVIMSELEESQGYVTLRPNGHDVRVLLDHPNLSHGIVFGGPRNSGKEGVTNLLGDHLLNSSKVDCDVLNRPVRRGDELRRKTGIRNVITEEEATDPSYRTLLGYSEPTGMGGGLDGDKASYLVPSEEFTDRSVLHVISPDAMQLLIDNGSLPKSLRVRITMDPQKVGFDDDVLTRVVTRLSRRHKQIPRPFDPESTAATEFIPYVDAEAKYMIQRIYDFENIDNLFHAVYVNSAALADEAAFIDKMWEGSVDSVLTDNIARRITKLYEYASVQMQFNGKKGIDDLNFESFHVEYLKSIVGLLYGSRVSDRVSKEFKSESVRPHSIKEGMHFSTRFITRAVTEYMCTHGEDFEPDAITDIMRSVTVHKVERSDDKKDTTIYLRRRNGGLDILAQDIPTPNENVNYLVLDIIVRYVELHTIVRPQLIIEGEKLVGFKYALDDSPESPILNIRYITR